MNLSEEVEILAAESIEGVVSAAGLAVVLRAKIQQLARVVKTGSLAGILRRLKDKTSDLVTLGIKQSIGQTLQPQLKIEVERIAGEFYRVKTQVLEVPGTEELVADIVLLLKKLPDSDIGYPGRNLSDDPEMALEGKSVE